MGIKSKSTGFTLIELIVVIGIISILSMAVLTILDPFSQFEKANDARRKDDLTQIQKALETYYGDHGRYPAYIISGTSYEIKSDANTAVAWGSSWPPYMDVVPQDPASSQSYAYYSDPNTGQSYWLYASLNRGNKDPQACNGGNACTSLGNNGIPSTACGGTCNFGLSSPNTSP